MKWVAAIEHFLFPGRDELETIFNTASKKKPNRERMKKKKKKKENANLLPFLRLMK